MKSKIAMGLNSSSSVLPITADVLADSMEAPIVTIPWDQKTLLLKELK